MPTNATPTNIGKDYTITTADNGQTLFLGDASSSRTAVKTIQFVPGPGFAGTGFSVVGRIYGPAADKAGVPFNPIPYRRIQFGNTASDRGIVSDVLPASAWLIEVPSNGITIGVVTSCTNGTGLLLNWDETGSPT